MAARYAVVDPNTSLPDDLEQELTIAGNWFFAGHRNKLTADLAWLTGEGESSGDQRNTRLRVQWDISF